MNSVKEENIMLRQIIKIDEDKCDGCGLCVSACHEGAIGLVEGKAKLLREDYCDGLGNCLPVCPTGAITFEEREAAAFNQEAVDKNAQTEVLPCGCPGTHVHTIHRETDAPVAAQSAAPSAAPVKNADSPAMPSQLRQWPVQIKLVPVNAAYFDNADLLVAADCAAYAHGNFHSEFMRDRITLIGCPKLDEGDYTQKLTAILASNNIKSVTVARMSVPCCGGIENAVKAALRDCGKRIPWQSVVIGTDGEVID